MTPTRRSLLRSIGAAGGIGITGTEVLGAVDGARADRSTGATPTPPLEEIPEGGDGEGFELVGHAPLLDDHQYVGDESFGIPRGSNADVAIAGDCVYVGSLVGYQPPLIVDIGDPADPEVVGPVPDAVPGVGNGIEGIEVSDDVLAIDHRRPLGGLGFPVPGDEPERGLSVYDVSEPREPQLVARYDYEGLDVHAATLWRDPEESDRLLATQTFTDRPNVKLLDLTGCPDPDDCDPEVVAEWSLAAQAGIDEGTHDAIVSTDGRRLSVSQFDAGVFLLDSTNLLESLRDEGGDDDENECDPSPPEETPGDEHCLTLLNPEPDDRLETDPPFHGEWQHTAIKVPGRPYLLTVAESAGPEWDDDEEEIETATCPGAFTRLVYVGEEEHAFRPAGDGEPMRGDRHPEIVGVFGLPEQRPEYCGPDGWETDDVAQPAWFSPHYATVFPDLAFVTYYGAGLRAIDISDPFTPVEAGYFFNDPVDEVRWASYGIQGETEYRDDDEVEIDGEPVDVADEDVALRRPAPGPNHMFAFSYPIVHEGYVVYADVHSGLYVLEYDGPHADEIPTDETCLSGAPGAAEPGFEPCPPFGETDWGTGK